MVVICGSFAQLRLKHGARNGGCMVKYQPAPIIGRGKQDAHSGQGYDQGDRPLDRAHSSFAHDSPERQHAKNPECDETELFVGLHHLVYCLTVVDTLFGLQT